MAPVTIYFYFSCQKFWARVAPIALTLDEAGVEYEIKDISEAPEGCGFAYPMMSLEDDTRLSQTIAITTHLGEKYGLNGSTPLEKTVNLQTMLDFDDMVEEIPKGVYKKSPERLQKWLDVFESRLKDPFFGDEQVATADFMAVFVISIVNQLFGKDYFEKCPKLAKWNAAIEEVPVVKKIKDSGVNIMPEEMKSFA